MNTKPNFQEMNRQELRAYVLAHRDDEEAFSAYMDQLHKDPRREVQPPLNSVDDLTNYPDFLQRLKQESEKQK